MTATASNKHRMQLANDELLDVAAFARSLDPTELAAPSLCARWRIDDVLSHLAWTGTVSLREALVTLGRSRFRPGPVMAGNFERAAIAYRRSHDIASIADTLERLGSGAPYGRGTVFGRPGEFLVDHVVHHFDIRRPLGKPRRPPEGRLHAALQAAPAVGGLIGSRKRARGLCLVATDIDWAHGNGPLVRGTAEALLLSLTGRVMALEELTGDGVPTLAARAPSSRGARQP